MHHFVSNAPWDDEAVLRVARDYVLEQMERHGAVAAWIVDDTGIPKKGRHSVGVTRQYCGVLGKQDNCQVAVTVTLANEAVSVPAAYRLYVPESWANDRRRRREAGIPKEVTFQTKWQIALERIAHLRDEGLPPAPVVADAGYGVVTAFRDALTAWAIPYVVGITKETTVWPPGTEPLPPRAYRGQGAPPSSCDGARADIRCPSGSCRIVAGLCLAKRHLAGRNTRQCALDFSCGYGLLTGMSCAIPARSNG